MNILRFLPLVLQAVETVERTVKDRGKVKKAKAIELTAVFITAAEGIVGRALLDTPEVQAALGDAIDAIVAFENAVRRAKGAVIPVISTATTPPVEVPPPADATVPDSNL